MIDLENDIKLNAEDSKRQAALRWMVKKKVSLNEYVLFLESVSGMFQADHPKSINKRKYYAVRFEL